MDWQVPLQRCESSYSFCLNSKENPQATDQCVINQHIIFLSDTMFNFLETSRAVKAAVMHILFFLCTIFCISSSILFPSFRRDKRPYLDTLMLIMSCHLSFVICISLQKASNSQFHLRSSKSLLCWNG
jgi:hypothetical protein